MFVLISFNLLLFKLLKMAIQTLGADVNIELYIVLLRSILNIKTGNIKIKKTDIYQNFTNGTPYYGVNPFLANYHSFTVSGRCDHFQVDSVK